MSKPPVILKTKLAAKSEFFQIEQVTLQFSNGAQRVFERMVSSRRGAVLIVPMLDDETLLLIKEYAVGTNRYELFFPKGLIDEHESAKEAANRELQEEIGFASRKIEFLSTMTSAPGYWGGKAEVFLARDLYASSLPGDEPEPLEIVEWKIADYKALLAEKTFTEARSIAALMLVRDKLNE